MITVTLQNDFFGTFVCPNETLDWQTFEHSLIRSEKWKSVFDGFGLSLTFTGGAYKFLLDCYNKFGQDVEVAVTVTESDYLGNQLTFNGLLNFAENATFERLTDSFGYANTESKFITLKVVPAPNDLKTTLESRSKAKIKIPLAFEEFYKSPPPIFFKWRPENPAPLDMNDNSLTDLRLFRPDKMFVHSRLQSTTDIYRHPQYPYIVSQGATNVLASDWFFNQELSAGNNTNIQTGNTTTLNHGNNASSVQPFFTAQNTGTYRVKVRMSGEFKWKNQGISNNSKFDFRLGYGTVANAAWHSLYQTGTNSTIGGTKEETINASLDVVVYLPAGENLYFYQRLTTTTNISQIIDFGITDFTIELSELTFSTARLTDGFFAHEFASALLNIITGNNNVLYSPVLGRQDSYPTAYPQDGNAGLLFITSGFLLRKQNKGIETSFDEFWESINACYNLGLWVDAQNQKIVIDNARAFYDPNIIAATFNFVDNISVSVAGDFIYNQISFRYSKFEDRGDGLNEDPHGEVNFVAPLKFTSNNYDLNCSYLASGESITIAKGADFRSKENDKTGYDTDKFFIAAYRSNRVKLPVLGAEANRLIIGRNDVSSWYFERFATYKPYFATSFPPNTFPSQFELFEAGVNNGIYSYNLLGGQYNGEAINISPNFADFTQIVPGTSYVEIIIPNDVFPYIAQTNQNYSLIQNYSYPITGFNYDLTPTRCLLRHKFLWNTGVQKTPSRFWRYGGGQGNDIFTSKKDAAVFDSDEYLQDPLKQNGNILPFDELLAARYIPEIIEFEAPMTIPEWIDLNNNRHGIVRVSNKDDKHLEGYVLEAKRVRQNEKVTVRFKLLRKFNIDTTFNILPPK